MPELKWYMNKNAVVPDGVNIIVNPRETQKRNKYGDRHTELDYKTKDKGTFNISCRAYGPDGRLWMTYHLPFLVKVTG